MYDRHKETKFKIAEDDDGYKLRVPLKYYLEYLIYNTDDSPLYLFESSLESKE
jgi:histone arginine demethylase JMJD6